MFICLFFLICRRHHKHDCLCAICVLKRRRKEREENDRIAKGNFGPGGDKRVRDFKQEVFLLFMLMSQSTIEIEISALAYYHEIHKSLK